MAAILLNESDPVRRELLRLRLERQGYSVWSANHLNEIISTLHDVAIDLMILDLDQHGLHELVSFSDLWRGIKIMFQASSLAHAQDFRSWMADQFVYKFQNDQTVARAVSQLIQDQGSRIQHRASKQQGIHHAHHIR